MLKKNLLNPQGFSYLQNKTFKNRIFSKQVLQNLWSFSLSVSFSFHYVFYQWLVWNIIYTKNLWQKLLKWSNYSFSFFCFFLFWGKVVMQFPSNAFLEEQYSENIICVASSTKHGYKRFIKYLGVTFRCNFLGNLERNTNGYPDFAHSFLGNLRKLQTGYFLYTYYNLL